jgi:cysteine desulfurase
MITNFGNPSSIHKLGEEAKERLNKCREIIAKTIGAENDEIIFTSGGSEGNNFALKGFVDSKSHIITTTIEHSSVLKACEQLQQEGIEITYLAVDSRGRIHFEDLVRAIKGNTVLVSIMHVNNEIGILQDVAVIGKLIKTINSNIIFHVDAVQSYGKIAVDVKKYNIDLMTMSAHKLHGPRGIGAIYMKKGLAAKSLILGGGQEFGYRSGTENLAAAVGFSIAAQIMNSRLEENLIKVKKLKEYFIRSISRIDGIRINSEEADEFLPYIINISAVGIRSGKILFYLNDRDIYVSKSSACSARGLKDSHVLKAIGLSAEEVMGSFRVSFSEENTIEEIDMTVDCIEQCIKKLKESSRNE